MRLILTTAVLSLVFAIPASADDALVDLTKVDRTITREPDYQSQPHYALLVFGPQAKQRSWLVIDGESVAYIDRNGNGDLTDAEDRVDLDREATDKIKLGGSNAYRAMHVFPLGEIGGTKLSFKLWVRNPDFDASQHDFYRDKFREWDQKKWVNGSLMRYTKNRAGSQNPLLLTVRPLDAQIAHFGGPVTAALKWGNRQKLEPWPKKFNFDVNLGCHNLLAKECDHSGFAYTRLSLKEVPRNVQPVARFEYPVRSADGKPVTRELRLDQRCCGDTFYASLMLPKDATEGMVKVTVTVPDWPGQNVEVAEFEVPINQASSRHSEASYILFHRPDIRIKDAVNVLRKRGLDVFIQPEHLLIHQDEKPTFVVRLVRSDEVQEVASSLGRGTEHAVGLGQCDARFEIGMMDFDKAVEKQSLLIEIQSAIQELTQGYVYQTWDKQLAAPR